MVFWTTKMVFSGDFEYKNGVTVSKFLFYMYINSHFYYKTTLKPHHLPPNRHFFCSKSPPFLSNFQ
jgi:hypothetical protein